jgi:PAS domain S-box-containing protein
LNIEESQIINEKIKVLHIDDEYIQLNNVKNNLEIINNNIIIESETDGMKSIEKIRKNDYDLILLDYLLPIYDGIEITNRIREISDVPIILYTIQDIEDINEKIFNSRINDYFKKDFNLKNYKLLEKKIKDLVKEYRIHKIFDNLINNMTDSIIIINNKYEIVYYNEQFKNKYKEKNIYGKPIFYIIEDLYLTAFNNYLLNDDDYIEIVMKNSNKINYDVEIHKTKININKKYIILNIKSVIADSIKSSTSNDINSDDRFNVIAEMSPDAIMMMNMWGYVTYANKAFSKLTGFNEDEIVGKHMFRLPTMAGRDLKPYMNLVKSFMSGTFSTKSIEFPYTRKDGSSGIGDAYLNLLKINHKRELIAIIKDVTDRKKNEEEYKNIFKTSPEGIIHLDLDGVIKDINESCIKILNIESDEYIGKKIYELDKNFTSKEFIFNNIYEKISTEDYIEKFEVELNLGGKVNSIEISVGLIKILKEKLGIQILLRDITQQKNMEKERKVYTEKLETLVEERTNQIVDNEKMVTMAKVSSMIAHDLKGPLQVIQNTLYLMQLKPENQDQYLDYIKNAVLQANDLIEEMRTQGRQTPLDIDCVNLSELIDESLIQVKTSEHISFETIIKTEKNIGLDKSKFIRVLNNLFKNAIEAMPTGGKLTVIVEEKENNIFIKITDTGVGIPPDVLKKLFRPFQSTKAKGMGLGLAFCKNTIESHGGEISVESELGKGTTFIITIPFTIEDELNQQTIKIQNSKDTLI